MGIVKSEIQRNEKNKNKNSDDPFRSIYNLINVSHKRHLNYSKTEYK